MDILQRLESLPDDFAWKSALTELAGALAGRLLRLYDTEAQLGEQHLLDYLDELFGTDAALPRPVPLSLPATPAGELLQPLSGPAQVVVLLTLAPQVVPGFIDQLVQEYAPGQGELPELGGVRGSQHRALLPTGETALFLLGGTSLPARQRARMVLTTLCNTSELLSLAEVPPGEPRFSGRLVVAEAVLEQLISHEPAPAPVFGPDFPAQRLHTNLDWKDLVLPTATRTLIDDITAWVRHHASLRTGWGLDNHLKPGYRVLFYGPSGTGKTLTAALLGQYTGRAVYRVDLSLVTSKYIGETEKNLGRLFDRAQRKNWILFFDEADALFGKRTETQNAHDRFANQEVAYLLQKIEDYDGLVILASNLKGNIDPAFSRRFQAMVPFVAPTTTDRLEFWKRALPRDPQRRDFDTSIDEATGVAVETETQQLASRYDLTGASIVNVVQFALLRALTRQAEQQGDCVLRLTDLVEGIRLEYQKEDKLL